MVNYTSNSKFNSLSATIDELINNTILNFIKEVFQ